MHSQQDAVPAASPRGERGLLWAISFAFFLSGVAALFYQVIWLRLLSTFFGNTTLALSVCLTAFMSGLALGSYLLGRWGDRFRHPFRVYALLEVAIGLYGLASPSLIGLVRSAYVGLAADRAVDSLPLLLFQFFACFFVLLIPTAMMGGTLPVITKGYIRSRGGVGADVAWLYGINTFGAATGALLVGFFLLPMLGLHVAVVLAALTNMVLGAGVLALDRRAAPPEVVPAEAAEPATDSDTVSPSLLVLLVIGFGVSGFSGLALEVVWGRALCMYMGSSIYAFSAVLFAVLLGIALGSVLASGFLARGKASASWFAVIQVAAGLATLSLVVGYNALPGLIQYLVIQYHRHYSLLIMWEVWIVTVFLLVPTMLAGATFPVLSHLCARERSRLARAIGMLYSANTLGCILGSAAAGFLLIPHVGLRNTVLLCGGLYLLSGAAVLFKTRERLAGVVAVGALVASIFLLPNWQHDVMSLGIFDIDVEAATSPDVTPGPEPKLTYYREGSTCTVAVINFGDLRTLKINGKADASTGLDRSTQMLSGHLPLLLADKTDRVLVVGLGCGASAGAATLHPAKEIDCVEIEPAVGEAAHYFSVVNHDVFSDPRFHLVFADARNYLAATRRKYDVISAEPSNPWVAGVASLYTVEHFQACRERLADDGLICQWLQAYSMSPEDLSTVIASFTKVFPEAMLFGLDASGVDLMLIARKHPWRLSLPALTARLQSLPKVRADLHTQGYDDPVRLIASLQRGSGDLRRLVVGARLNTDDLPRLEFSAPLNLYRATSALENYGLLSRFGPQPIDELVDFGGPRRAAFREVLANQLLYRFDLRWELVPGLRWVRSELTAAAAQAPLSAQALEQLALSELTLGDRAQALRHARAALALDPSRSEAQRIAREAG